MVNRMLRTVMHLQSGKGQKPGTKVVLDLFLCLQAVGNTPWTAHWIAGCLSESRSL